MHLNNINNHRFKIKSFKLKIKLFSTHLNMETEQIEIGK